MAARHTLVRGVPQNKHDGHRTARRTEGERSMEPLWTLRYGTWRLVNERALARNFLPATKIVRELN